MKVTAKSKVTYELRCPDCKRYIPSPLPSSVPVHNLTNGDECSGSGKRATGVNVKAEHISLELEANDDIQHI
jgi:hypothetical protein